MKQVLFYILIMLGLNTFAQNVTSIQPVDNKMTVFAKVENGDTIPIVQLPEVKVYAIRVFEGKRDIRSIQRMINNVKKAYPYARLAGLKLQEYEGILENTKTDSERRKIMRQAEKELNEQFGEDLKDLTFTQGKILLKLIDRETGDVSYNLVRDLRGGITAVFYQGFARIWGYNLKSHYDPEGEDELIETIVEMIENGQL
ncbi:MAG: DUF4294 domain-containing protein [Bacteroidales bacterium]